MDAPANLFLCQCCKEAFDKIEPRRTGRCEVDVKAWTLGKPAANGLGLVCAVVVQDQMDVEIVRNGGIDRIEELAELHTAMAPVEFANHRAGLYIQRRKQRRRAMACIVVSPAFDLAGAHR